MTTKTYSLLWLLLFNFCWYSGIHSQEQEARSVSDSFTQISVGSGIGLYLTQGAPVKIIVEADKSVIDKIMTRVQGGVLKIYVRDNLRWVRSRTLKVHLTMPEITGISVSGGGDFKAMTLLKTPQLTVDCSGGGDAYLTVEASHVELYASGGAGIQIKGVTRTLKAGASGGADIGAQHLKAQKAVVESSGGADIKVFAEEEIEVNASGGGDVDYFGMPGKKSINKSGGADVTEK